MKEKPTIEHLIHLDRAQKLKKYPSFVGKENYLPDYKPRPNSTNGLTRCIVDYLNLSGHVASRISSTGQARVTGKKQVDFYSGATKGNLTFIPGTQRKGMADIRAILHSDKHEFGVPVEIEVKFSKSDRQRKEQKTWQQDVERVKGVYIIVRSWEDFANWFEQFTKEL